MLTLSVGRPGRGAELTAEEKEVWKLPIQLVKDVQPVSEEDMQHLYK